MDPLKMKTIGEQYMIFLRSFENYTYDITLGSKIIIFFFDSLTMNELPYYQHPYGILPQPISKWIELKIVEPLYGFLELVGQYLENNFLNYPLYELKRTELFYLLKKLYRKEELDYFFYLSSTHSAEFERLIAENYIKAKTVTDLAQMIGYGINSFRMKFKKVFGIPRRSTALVCQKSSPEHIPAFSSSVIAATISLIFAISIIVSSCDMYSIKLLSKNIYKPYKPVDL